MPAICEENYAKVLKSIKRIVKKKSCTNLCLFKKVSKSSLRSSVTDFELIYNAFALTPVGLLNILNKMNCWTDADVFYFHLREIF